MKAPSLGEAAIDLAWIPPCAGSLAALARGDSSAWSRLRRDPGCLLLLAQSRTAEAASASSFTAVLQSPTPLEAALDYLEKAPFGFVDWSRTGLAFVYQTCLRQARLAAYLAERSGACGAEAAWVGGMLAPLGWLAACAIAPDEAATFFPKPAGFEPTQIARRLARRWQLPAWLASVVGQLGLPVEIARNLGAEPAVFRVVQLAVLLHQRDGGGLGLPVGGVPADLLNVLGLTGDDADRAVEASRSGDAVAEQPWLAPASQPLLAELLRLALESRRRGDRALVERMQQDLDLLQSALESQCAGEGERLQAMKLSALAELAAGAGHEINNPLAVISGQAQYLLHQEADPARQKALQAIINQAHRVHTILTDLMQFARPSAPQRQAVDATLIVRDVAASLQHLAESRQVRLETADLPASVFLHADPNQVRTALTGLLRNGIEAAPSLGWVPLRVEKNGSELVHLIVEDSGPGPGPHIREHLFDPFYSGRSAGRGRGLGLPTAWRLARQHGGDVRFDPLTHGLTRFILTLPAADGPTEPAAETNGHHTTRNGTNGSHSAASPH